MNVEAFSDISSNAPDILSIPRDIADNMVYARNDGKAETAGLITNAPLRTNRHQLRAYHEIAIDNAAYSELQWDHLIVFPTDDEKSIFDCFAQ